MDSRPEKPLATSTLYINRFTTTNADKSQDHTIVGMHVVLKKGNANGLWETLHVDRSQQKLDANGPRVATRSLQIYCDTLEVHGEFSAPEADVSVFCRRLVWASGDAAINTSLLAWAVGKAQDAVGSQPGKNGAAGRNAGSFHVFVSKAEPTGDTRPRLIALGASPCSSTCIPLKKRPRISRLFFKFSCDISPAPAHQRVLKVRSMGSTGGAVIECSPDLGGRGNGFEHMIRIYSKDANVRLNVPSHVGGAAFKAWDVVGTQTDQVGVEQKEINVKLNTNLLAQCHWNRSNVREPKPVVSRVVIPEEAKMAVKLAAADDIKDAMESALAVARVEMIDLSESQTHERDLLMRAKASNEAAVLGVAPTMDDTELVEEANDGWKLVNYRGIVGWVSE